jgi:hypothetical protein
VGGAVISASLGVDLNGIEIDSRDILNLYLGYSKGYSRMYLFAGS